MTGPEGDKHYGVWRVAAVDPPYSLELYAIFLPGVEPPLPRRRAADPRWGDGTVEEARR